MALEFPHPGATPDPSDPLNYYTDPNGQDWQHQGEGWVRIVTKNGIEEANVDGEQYARQDGAWAKLAPDMWYLGPKPADPTTDNYGQPLQSGHTYYNTDTNLTMVYDGASWNAMAPNLIAKYEDEYVWQIAGTDHPADSPLLFPDIYGQESTDWIQEEDYLLLYIDGLKQVEQVDAGVLAGDYTVDYVANQITPLADIPVGSIVQLLRGSTKAELFADIHPYVSGMYEWVSEELELITQMLAGETKEIVFKGGNFDTATTVSVTTGTINSIVASTNDEITISYTASSDEDDTAVFTIKNGEKAHFGDANVILELNGSAFLFSWVVASGADTVKALTLTPGETYNFTVDWGDGTSSTITGWDDPDVEHEYGYVGSFNGSIVGTCPALRFLPATNIRTVENLGGVGWKTMYQMFKDCTTLLSIASPSSNLSGVTSFEDFCAGATGLQSVDLSQGHTLSACTSMINMFAYAFSADTTDPQLLDLSNMQCPAVENFSNMFDYVGDADPSNWQLDIKLAGFTTPAAKSMYKMFNYASVGNYASSGNLDLSSFDTSQVTDFSYMFSHCTAKSLGISSFNVGNALNMGYMFSGAGVDSLDVSSFHPVNCVYMSNMFSRMLSIRSPITFSNFNSVKVVDMSYMFFYTNYLYDLNLSSWSVDSVTTMKGMFQQCTLLTSVNMSTWTTSALINMDSMFASTRDLVNITINHFDVSKLTSAVNCMSYAPGYVTDEHDLVLANWALQTVKPNVTFDAYLANHTNEAAYTILTNSPNNWTINDQGTVENDVMILSVKVSEIDTALTMTKTLPLVEGYAYNFTVDWGDGSALDTITAWDDPAKEHVYTAVPGVTVVQIKIVGTVEAWDYDANPYTYIGSETLAVSSMGDIGLTTFKGLFSGCTSCTKIVFTNIDSTLITSFERMFEDCNVLTNVNLDAIVTDSALTLERMFLGCSSLPSLLIGHFNAPNVTNIDYMYSQVTAATVIGPVFGSTVVSAVGVFANAEGSAINQYRNIDFTNITDITNLFSNANINDIDMSAFNAFNATYCWRTFYRATAEPGYVLDLSGWVVPPLTYAKGLFESLRGMGEVVVTLNFDANCNVVDLFKSAEVTTLDIGHWDTSPITHMGTVFKSTPNLVDCDISDWDISAVDDMSEFMQGNTTWSDTQYDAVLTKWSALPPKENPSGSIHFGDAKYTNVAARDVLTSAPYNWDITDGGPA